MRIVKTMINAFIQGQDILTNIPVIVVDTTTGTVKAVKRSIEKKAYLG